MHCLIISEVRTKCQVQGQSGLYTSQAYVRSTSSTFQMISCTYCPQQLSSVKMFNKHLSDCHPDILPFNCSICGKGFQTKTGQQLHIQTHAGRTFLCNICDSKFKRKHHLQEHTKRIHHLCLCGKCLATFKNSTEYNQHIAQCVAQTEAQSSKHDGIL